MVRTLIKAAVVIGGLGGAVAAGAAMHATAEFEEGATRPRTIVFLPPHASLVRQKVIKSEQQIEESTELATYLGANVEAQFKAQGYEVRVLRPDEINADPALQELRTAATPRC